MSTNGCMTVAVEGWAGQQADTTNTGSPSGSPLFKTRLTPTQRGLTDTRTHLDRVAGLHVQRDRLARQGLDEDLHAAPQTQHQVQSALLLDVVVGQGAAVLQLLAREDEALLVRRDALLVLDLLLHVLRGQG